MRTLIITEKPSVARDFGRALGVGSRRDGYLTNGNVTITWAVGHLLELFEPHEYDPKWRKWHFNTLPVIPASFRYKPISGTKKQLRIIQSLLSDQALDRVVIATDAGREGEVIARTILLSSTFKDSERVYRFWTSQALTPEVVRDGLNRVRPASDYDRLWRAGQARQVSDWLVGINGSRAATLRLGDLFSVGRVQTAVLALLVDRLRQRERFQPQPYWVLRARFENPEASWWGTWFKADGSRILEQETAEQLAAKIRDQAARVEAVKKQVKKIPPPSLYSLTDLQRDANKKYGFTAKQTLDIAQVLYDQKKCLSYPRTESRVLGSQNIALVKDLIGRLRKPYRDLFSGIVEALVAGTNKRVFNDAKLTDHHAIIPLAALPKNCNREQARIYQLVLERFAAAFHPDHQYEQTEAITRVADERFRSRGRVVLVPGWKTVYGAEDDTGKEDETADNQNLPPLDKGTRAHVAEDLLDRRMTKPPPAYTEALLLKDMTNPSRYVDQKALKQVYRGDVGLGTQATRAQIIETLLQRKYAIREKKLLTATGKGCRLIDTLRQFPCAGKLTSAEETARWERQLAEIARGKGSMEGFLEDIRSFVADLTRELQRPPPGIGAGRSFGTCPRCGGTIIEGRKGYGCSNWRKRDGACRFVIWKEYQGRRIPAEAVGRLLQNRRVDLDPDSDPGNKDGAVGHLRLVQNESGQWQVAFQSGVGEKR